jgi:hypothetical protein
LKNIPDKFIVWGASVVVTVAMAVGFLFITFQTSAAADKQTTYFDSRLDRLEQKIDQLLEQKK